MCVANEVFVSKEIANVAAPMGRTDQATAASQGQGQGFAQEDGGAQGRQGGNNGRAQGASAEAQAARPKNRGANPMMRKRDPNHKLTKAAEVTDSLSGGKFGVRKIGLILLG